MVGSAFGPSSAPSTIDSRMIVNINGTGPLVGPYLSDFLLGGPEFGATTLSRFYAIHMLLIPGAIAALIGAHLYLVTKLGTTAPPWMKAEEPEQLHEERV